jgi:hypothetical protein
VGRYAALFTSPSIFAIFFNLQESRHFGEETKMRYLSWMVALLLIGTGLCPAAELGQQVGHDLAPLSGHIIAVRTDDYLIDLDATAGVRSGDLFAVIHPGQNISDPATGKVIGREEEVAAVLRVSQVMRGFSKTLPLGRAGAIHQGDAIRRYALLQTTFWDYTGHGERVYTDMRENLPDLKWADYGAAQRQRPKEPAFSGTDKDLFFILKSAMLEVRDGQGRLIKAYKIKTDVVPVASTEAPAPSAGKAEMIATVPMAVRYADFISDGKRNLLAATDDKYIRVYAIGADAALQASWSPNTVDRIVAVRWWRPDPQAPLYLAATLWPDQSPQVPRGVLLRLQDNTLNLVETVVLSVLGTFDRNGDGVPETLVKQEFNTEYFFGRHVKILHWSGDKLSAEPLKFDLPNGFTAIGSMLGQDLNGDGKTETAMIQNGFLFIYQGGEQLYKSSRKVGGSIDTLTYNATPGMQDYRLDTVCFELSPLLCDIDGDGRKEMVVPAADGVNRVLPGLPAEVDRSWLAVIRNEHGNFVTRDLSESFERPIQGIGLSPQGIMFLTTQHAGGRGAHGQATVYRFPVHSLP